MKKYKKFQLNIADLIVSVDCQKGFFQPEATDPWINFLVVSDQKVDLKVTADYSGFLPNFNLAKLMFNSGSTWQLFQNDDSYIFTLYMDTAKGRKLYKICVVNKNFNQAQVFLAPDIARLKQINPLEYPLGELLFVTLLGLKGGVEVHACAPLYKDKADLFVGISGSGKTTMAKFWHDKQDAKVLSDDRVIIRKTANKFYAYGTPWHGEGRFNLAACAEVKNVYFLKKAPFNDTRKLTPNEAVARMLVAAFLPFYNKAAVKNGVSFFAQFCQAVPCYELAFKNDTSVIDFLLNFESEVQAVNGQVVAN